MWEFGFEMLDCFMLIFEIVVIIILIVMIVVMVVVILVCQFGVDIGKFDKENGDKEQEVLK